MKATIRNHPKIREGIVNSWPVAGDAWSASGPIKPGPIGEQGTLKEIKFLTGDHSQPDRLYIEIEFHGNAFSGLLKVDDTTVLPKLYTFFQSHKGEELKVIGGLEIELP
jgi:hypothetical protein